MTTNLTFPYTTTVVSAAIDSVSNTLTSTTLAVLSAAVTLETGAPQTTIFSYYSYSTDKDGRTTSVEVPVTTTIPIYHEVGSVPKQIVQKQSKSSTPMAAAGAAIGGVVVGAILAAVVLMLILRRKHSRTVQQMRENWDSEKESIQANEYHKAQTLLYNGMPQAQVVVMPSPEDERNIKELSEAHDKIRALEADRNAASAFGDTLDRRSEQEILSSPQFGLVTYNQTVNQAVMALAVGVTGKGTHGKGRVEMFDDSRFASIKVNGPEAACNSLEAILSHTIHTILYTRVCQPFIVGVQEEGSQEMLKALQHSIKISCDQGIFARWRSLTHRAIRLAYNQGTGDVSNLVRASITAEIRASLEELLVWCGMEPDRAGAQKAITKINGRLSNAVEMLIGLTNVLNEEMASNDYSVVAFEPPQLTKSLGIVAASAEQGTPTRVLLAPVSA